MKLNTFIKITLAFIMSSNCLANYDETEALTAIQNSFPNSQVEINSFEEKTNTIERFFNTETYKVQVTIENTDYIEKITYMVFDGRTNEKGRVVYNIKERRKTLKHKKENLLNYAIMNYLNTLKKEIFEANIADKLTQDKLHLLNYGSTKILDLQAGPEKLSLNSDQIEKVCTEISSGYEELTQKIGHLISYTNGIGKIAKGGVLDSEKMWQQYYGLKAANNALSEEYLFQTALNNFYCSEK